MNDSRKASASPGNDQAPGEGRSGFGDCRMATPQKPDHVHHHFSAIAHKYDFMNTLLSLGMHYRWKRLSVEALALIPGEIVIDVCGGTADLSLLASRAVGPRGRVILCDFNRAMIDAGLSKIVKASLRGRILAVQGDAESLSFPENTFNAAMVGFGIRNLTHMEKGLAEMHRVLKVGGKIMCLEFSLPVSGWLRLLYDFYSFCLIPLAGKALTGNRGAYLHLTESIRRFPPPSQVVVLLEEAGFSDVSCRRLTNGIAMIYTGLKPNLE